MQPSLRLELADARRLVAAAQAEAARCNARVTIALCDSGGHLLLLERRDGANGSSAATAAAMGGGLPLLHGEQCLGAIGVSGMTPELDAAIAAAGVAVLAELIGQAPPA